MADLTRLRAILLDHGSTAIPVGSAVYHLTRSPFSREPVDAALVSDVVRWLSTCPGSFFGEVLSSSAVSPVDFGELLRELDDRRLAEAATLVNAMYSVDDEWDRGTRDLYSTATAVHDTTAARVGAQSSAEFAALDALTAAGYAGIDDAVGALAAMRRVFKNTCRVHVRQMSRSRHAFVGRFERGDGSVRIVITPWCLSRRNAQAYAAVCLADWRRQAVEDALVRRARTVASFAERTSLQAVRDIVAPALALLTRYAYSSMHMAFVNERNAVVQGVGSRAPYVAVAFAAVFTAGGGDAVMTLAAARTAVANTISEPVIPRTAQDYLQTADSPFTGLALFTRALAEYRLEREASKWGERVNKGAMLGYVARERDKVSRNTSACINRIEEVACLLNSRGKGKGSTLLVVEWGGHVHNHAVLGAAAAAKLDIALDVAGSGVDVPGMDVYDDHGSPPHHYQLYLASAKARMLPRMPSVSYALGTPLVEKMRRVFESVGGESSGFSLAYLSGGMSQLASTPLSVCSDSAACVAALDAARLTLPVDYYATEVLLPPACHHVVEESLSGYMSAWGFDEEAGDDPSSDRPIWADNDCDQCDVHYRALAAVGDIIDRDGIRLVKPRSVFAHNSLFGVEWVGTSSAPADSMTTLDAAIACNTLRNYPFTVPPPDPEPGRDVTSPELNDLLRDSIVQVHTLLAGPFAGPVPDGEAQSIAASVN